MNYHHKVDASIWLNTAFLQDYNYYDDYQNEYNPFSYRFNYNTGLDKFSKYTDITLHSRLLDGLNLNKIKLKKYDYSKKNIFYASFKSMYRAEESDLRYTNYKVWESDKFNNTATFGELKMLLKKCASTRCMYVFYLDLKYQSTFLQDLH